MSYYHECPECGSHLDPGERCFDCTQKKAAPELEPPKAAKDMIAPSVYGKITEKSREEGALCPGITPTIQSETPSDTLQSRTDNSNGSPSAPIVENQFKTDIVTTLTAEDSAPNAMMKISEKNSTEAVQELISLIQEPIIVEHLHSLKARIESRVSDAMALVCTEETIQVVKATRSAMNREFKELEDKRKAIKAAVLDPYNAFEVVYKECVSDIYGRGDLALKQKVNDVESEMKRQCEDALREYFSELCEAHHIDFVTYEQAGITISMADAKAKTQPPKKLREQLTKFVADISKGVETISEMENADEIMEVFKRTLDATGAIGTVLERHRRIEAEKAAREAREAARSRAAEAVKKVEAVAPPIIQSPVEAPVAMPNFTPPAPVQPVQNERICKSAFIYYGTMSQLKELKEFMDQSGGKYEVLKLKDLLPNH